MRWKDSVSNIEKTGEFCWNLATMDLAGQMNATSAHVPHEVNEFTIAGLTAAQSKIVNVPRVAESPASFECRLSEIVQLKGANGEKAEAWLTLGEVVQSTSTKPSYDMASTKPLSRVRSCGQGVEVIISKFVLTRCLKCRGRIKQFPRGFWTQHKRREGQFSFSRLYIYFFHRVKVCVHAAFSDPIACL